MITKISKLIISETRMAKYLLLFYFICLIQINLTAQDSVTIGSYRKLESKILSGEILYIEHLPEDYGNSGKEYPVVFIMNGQDISAFANAVSTIENLSTERIPDIILIGISNTGVAQNTWACPDDSGKVVGAANFYNFLEKELLPEIKKNYRTNNYKILMGQSNSGLFVLHCFFTNPDLFNAYIVASPMFGWCPDYFLNQTKTFLDYNKTINQKLYISYGDLDYVEVLNFIQAFKDILIKQSPKGFSWQLNLIENCGHVPQATLNNALLFFLSGYTMTAERKKYSVPEIKSYFENLSREYGFTVHPKGGILFDIAYDLRNGKQYDKAIELLNYLIVLYPNSSMYYYALGSTHYQNGDIESAKENLKESLRIDPKFVRSVQLLSKINKNN
jgi:predicted alpha/beta superfamily hydrolase